PVAAWPVASVVARVDLLAGTFVLLAWLGLASEPSSTWLAALCFMFGLLCKESAAAFLVVPILFSRTSLRTAGAFGAGATLYLAARGAAGLAILPGAGLIDPLTNPLGVLPAAERVPAAIALTGRYLLYLLVPAGFHDPVNYLGGAPLPGYLDPVV